MKKFLAIILALAMVLGLCACGGNTGNDGDSNASGLSDGLNVGWGRANVTPDFSVGIGGYSDAETRKSTGFLDYVYATCIAFTEGEETILLFTIDNCAASTSVVNKIRDAVTAVVTDVPADHIFVSATHTHSAPALTSNDADGKQYQELFYPACAQAAQDAMADRSAATIYGTTTVLEGMNFVRHYLMSDGSYAGSNFGDFTSNTIVGHATAGDDEMQLLKLDRADESKQDILMINWQTHPDHAKANGYNNISADHAGAARTKVENETGMLCAYFTGAAGNQNPDSRISEEMHHLGMKEYGEALADAAIAALPNLTVVEGSGIKTNTVQFEVEIDHSWDSMLTQANEVYDLWKTVDKASGDALGKTYGFTSVYQARAIRSRAGMAATATKEMNVFSVGGIGFVNGDYEMFSTAGLYIKENSEYDITFIVEGCSGYIPSAEAYDYRSYEADTGYYAKGTGEKLAEQFVTMLNALN